MAEDKKEVTVRNKSDAEHTFTDVVGGFHTFKPGEVKTIKVSASAAEELEERSDNEGDAFELASKGDAKKAEKEKLDAEKKAADAEAKAREARAQAENVGDTKSDDELRAAAAQAQAEEDAKARKSTRR